MKSHAESTAPKGGDGVISGVDTVSTLRATYRLLAPFFQSRHRVLAVGLIAYLIANTFMGTALALYQNTWHGQWMDALTARKTAELAPLLRIFGLIMAGMLLMIILESLVGAWLDILWRTWATHRLLDRWLSREAFYRIEREQVVDNPDQRITEDADLFMDYVRSLALGAFHAIVNLVAFSGRLWVLSGPLQITLIGTAISVPGYLFWVAILYAVLTNVLVHLAGRALMRVEFGKQRAEANFRFMAASVREHSEQIALYHGSTAERGRLAAGFEDVRRNFWIVLKVKLRTNPLTSVLALSATIVPMVASLPAYLAGNITIGQIVQVGAAFTTVTQALSWFAFNYPRLQSFRVVVARLYGLQAATEPSVGLVPTTSRIDHAESKERVLSLDDVELQRPNGDVLTSRVTLRVEPGERWLIRGPSGVGKSTLMRAMAGIWPYGNGRIRMPEGSRLLFLPQKSYIPPGSLRAAVSFPSPEGGFDDAACRDALRSCGLAAFEDRLDETARWGQQMSLGEQQRLAFARALLHRPDYLFLDEATSALDPRNEQLMYHVLLMRLPETALVSVAHHTSVEAFHLHKFNLLPADDESASLQAGSPHAPQAV
ncbi:MAG TPA: ABC transporter ATP-binding protein/permease [Roseateles sp.]